MLLCLISANHRCFNFFHFSQVMTLSKTKLFYKTYLFLDTSNTIE